MYSMNDIVRLCREYDGHILFQDGDVWELDEEKCIYADVRTKYDETAHVHDVFPVAFEGNHYSYICPTCGMIHKYHKDEVNGQVLIPGCWNVNCGKKGKRFAVLTDKGVMMKLPMQKIRFHKEGDAHGDNISG